MINKIASGILAAQLLTSAAAWAAEPLKIGYIGTLSGPSAHVGQELLDGFNLGITSVGGKLGGREVSLIVGDDQVKPDIGRQIADKMIERDRVDIITGINWSNVMLAIAKPVADAKIFMISSNAGPSQIAGAQCSPLTFVTSFQNDAPNEAMGIYMKKKGFQNVYLMAPNYPAGRDMLTGFKRYFDGKIAGEVYTQLGQLDYVAELAQLRAAKPSALYYFISAGPGINFIKQYAQSGLKTEVPLFAPSFSLDQTIFPATGDAAIGATIATFWSPDLKNPANDVFLRTFQETFKRVPSPYAAQAYDTARIIDAALKTTNGKMDDKPAFQRALEQVKFDSVRGHFRFNTNHYPIQDYYLAAIEKGADGTPAMVSKELIVAAHGDPYAKDCKMTH